jgi:hypothetical protein
MFGNMRANGVRSLNVSCWQRQRAAILSAALLMFGLLDGVQAMRVGRGVRGAMKITEYICDGCYPVRATDMTHAAQLFAVQLARRKHGLKGRSRSVQLVPIRPPGRRSRLSSAFRMAWRGGAASHGSPCDQADAR